MPLFDPNLPQEGTELDAVQMRSQFNGLKAILDAINAATVDGVTTLNPGDPAQVLLSLIANTLHFTFAIPRGHDGGQGDPGPTGPQGPPFANAVVDGVTTLPAGSAAAVSLSFDGTNVHFTFGIPEGQTGGTGGPGEQGPPGEVTQAAMQAALALKAQNPSTVNTLPGGAPASYDQLQMQEMIDKMNELINALK